MDPEDARAIEGHIPSLRRYARSLTGSVDRADDLVQDCLERAVTRFEQFQPGTDLRAWLFTILHNAFISELRKYRREVEDVDGAMAATLSEEPRQEHVLALKELGSAIASLPNIQRKAVVLMGAYGFSQLEAADTCRCTVGTVKSRVSRGRATLNQVVGRNEVAHCARTPRARAMLEPAELPRENLRALLVLEPAGSE